jgi:hypothetical protein
MIKRSTWITIVALALLVALAWYLQQPDNAFEKIGSADATPTNTLAPIVNLIDLQGGAVEALDITGPAGETVSMISQGGVWIVKVPYEGLADQSAVQQIVGSIAYTTVTATFDKNPDLKLVGLDQPTIITLTFTGGAQTVVKVGKATPTDSGYYVQVDDGPVQVVDKYYLDALLGLLTTPPFMYTATPSPTATEPPTGTVTPTPTAEVTGTPAIPVATSLPTATNTP